MQQIGSVSEPLRMRFWEKVDQNGKIPSHCPELGACWEWTAVTDRHGYGRIKINGRMMQAHRVMWKMAAGTEPGSLHVLHHCDNRKCVNPDHLYLGTNTDNVRDRERKGRGNQVCGERHHLAKLTERDVRHIRQRYKGGATVYQIAREYGVDWATIDDCIKRNTWRHVA